MQCRWQVEIDPWCRRVLAKQWPAVRRWGDVRTWPQHDTEPVDLICGGFPCQDISNAGKRKGITGERSGLWKEFARILRVVRPRYALIENVSAILGRGMDTVLCDLAKIGFDAEWQTVRTGLHLGHQRSRVFVVAYSDGSRLEGTRKCCAAASATRCESIFTYAASLPGSQPASDVVRSVHGIPRRVDRIRGLGNAVVPQVAELIGRMILEQEATHDSRHR